MWDVDEMDVDGSEGRFHISRRARCSGRGVMRWMEGGG